MTPEHDYRIPHAVRVATIVIFSARPCSTVYLLVFWYPKAVGTFFDSQWDEICRQWPPQKSLIFEGRSTPKSRFQSEAFGSATAPSLCTLELDHNGWYLLQP